MTNATMYTATVWYDNSAAVKNTQMEVCGKLKSLDDSLEKIKADLELRDREGRKRDISVTHGDFIKSNLFVGTMHWPFFKFGRYGEYDTLFGIY